MLEHKLSFYITAKLYYHYICKIMEKQELKIETQINYYFDTADFKLYHSGSTLKISQIDSTLKLQYNYIDGKTTRNKIYKERELDAKIWKMEICGDVLSDFLDNQDDRFSYIGNLVTESYTFEFDDNIVLLHKNYYLGICDYELEIICEDYSFAQDIISELDININTLNDSYKYGRFVQAYKGTE